MATITPDYQIAAGNDNAGGLTLVTSLTDTNGVNFMMPRGLPHRERGERVFKTDGTSGRLGRDSTSWLSSAMTVAQYKHVLDTYEGLVTIRVALSSTTFANYNASLWMPDENELEYIYLTGATGITGFTGPGYRNVMWNFINMVAL